MSQETEQVFAAAAALPPDERRELAERLLESLDDEPFVFHVTPELRAEWDRRSEALRDGTDQGVTWEEVKRQARAAVGK